MTYKSKRARACDIKLKTKNVVWERDGECCIICGSPQAMPNAHYIPRSRGGLGIEENVVTLCQQCHHDFDNGDKQEEYKVVIGDYLKNQYEDWEESKLYFTKY